MTPDQIKQARHTLGLTLAQMGEMLGYEGNHVRVQMDDLETGRRPLRGCQERLLRAYLDGYRPPDWPRDTE
jgi:DNA-binding transcriptional regulator YiaG